MSLRRYVPPKPLMTRPAVTSLQAALVTGLPMLTDLFRIWDEAGSGLVSKWDFTQALSILGNNFGSPAQPYRDAAHAVFDLLDEECAGAIMYGKLHQLISPDGASFRGVPVSRHVMQARAAAREIDAPYAPRVQAALRYALAGRTAQVINLLREWDDMGTGGVTRRDFWRALPLLKLQASRADSDAVFASLCPRGAATSVERLSLTDLRQQLHAERPQLAERMRGRPVASGVSAPNAGIILSGESVPDALEPVARRVSTEAVDEMGSAWEPPSPRKTKQESVTFEAEKQGVAEAAAALQDAEAELEPARARHAELVEAAAASAASSKGKKGKAGKEGGGEPAEVVEAAAILAEKQAAAEGAKAALKGAKALLKGRQRQAAAMIQAAKMAEQGEACMRKHRAALEEAEKELSRQRQTKHVDPLSKPRAPPRKIPRNPAPLAGPWEPAGGADAMRTPGPHGTCFPPGKKIGQLPERPPGSRFVPRPPPDLLMPLRKVLADRLPALLALFRSWDIDGNGTVSLFELQTALAALQIPVADQQALTALFDLMDSNKSGALDFGEMRRALMLEPPKRPVPQYSVDQGAVSKRRGDGRMASHDEGAALQAIWRSKQAVTKLKRNLAEHFMRVADVFKEWDKDMDGSVTLDELRRAFAALSLITDEPALKVLFAQIDVDNSGAISLSELNDVLKPDARRTKRASHVRSATVTGRMGLGGGTNKYNRAAQLRVVSPQPTQERLPPLTKGQAISTTASDPTPMSTHQIRSTMASRERVPFA